MGKKRRLRRQAAQAHREAAQAHQAVLHPRGAPIHPPSPVIGPEHLSTVQLVTVLTLLVVLSAVAYRNTLQNEFVLDDITVIVENPVIRDVGNIGKIFTTSYWSEKYTGLERGLYRPLTVFSYAVDYAFWKLKPLGYHLVNLALHLMNTLLLFLVAISILKSPLGAFAAASVFAVHPVHTEAVTGVVGRAEALAAFFFLLAFWFGKGEELSWSRQGSKFRSVGSRTMAASGVAALFYFLGLLSKENAVTLPALLLVYDLSREEQSLTIPAKGKPAEPSKLSLMFRRYAGFGMVLLLYLPLRSHVVGTTQAVWSGWAGVHPAERIWTASRVLMEYWGLLIFPRTLSADYWIPDVPIARSAGEPLVLLSLLLWVALGVVAVFSWRKSRPLFVSLAWFFITILPASNFLFAAGHGKAERILYLPSAGFCLFIGGLYGLLENKIRKQWLLLLPLFPILTAFGIRTYDRNADWKDNFTLALATLKVSPTSPLLNQIAASEYRKRGESAKAVPLLQEAIRQRPEDYSYYYNLGNAYLDLKRYDAASASYQQALKLKPESLDALNNLGQAQALAGKNAEAVKTFTALLSKNWQYLGAYLNLGTAYLNLGDLPNAARVFRDGLSIFPNHGGLHFDLGVVLNRMGQKQEADQEYQKAIALDPSLRNFQ